MRKERESDRGRREGTETQTHLTGLQECSKDQQCQTRSWSWSWSRSQWQQNYCPLALLISSSSNPRSLPPNTFVCCMLQFLEATKFTFVLLSPLTPSPSPPSTPLYTPCCFSRPRSSSWHVEYPARTMDWHGVWHMCHMCMARNFRNCGNVFGVAKAHD